MAAKTAEHVISFEVDPNVLELARYNKESKDLFQNPKIELIADDVSFGIKKFKDNTFDAIIHDPPRLSLAGELYGMEFYKELYRVLKPEGRLYHYTGNPSSKFRSKDIMGGVVKRLKKAGFREVKKVETVLGVVAKK